MKKLYFAAILLLFCSLFLSAEIKEELEKILPEQIVQELMKKESLQNSAYKQENESLKLFPNISLVKDGPFIQSAVQDPFFIETLYLYKKTEKNSTTNDIKNISIILRSLSHLEGIQYYSASRKTMRTLYEKSYVVDGIKTKNRLPDPVQGSADGLVLAVLQKDMTFGENIYKYSYKETENSVAFYSQNSESMRYNFIKLIDANNLHMSLIVQDLGDYLLIYGVTSAKFLAIPGIDKKINESFLNRSEAIYKWFISEYEK